MISADQERVDWLNDYLDARATGNTALPRDLDQSMAEAVQRFFARDDAPAPPPELTKRIGDELMNQATYAGTLPIQPAVLVPPSFNGRAIPRLGPMGGKSGTTAQRLLHSHFVRYVIAAILLLSLGLGYFGYNQFNGEPGSPAMIPAVVAPAATPEATDFSEANHPLVGAWLRNWEPGDPVSEFESFHADGTYTAYDDFVGVHVGTWRATGERTAELVFIVQHPIVLDTQSEPGFALPETVFTGDAVTSWISVEVDESGNSWVGNGYYEPRDANGEVIVHFDYDVTLTGTRLAPVDVDANATPES